ncbi:MAG: amidohydrolase [Nitrospinota bacterium]|nr:MAG: amidohydrolase [Nitrospinota bacterium]
MQTIYGDLRIIDSHVHFFSATFFTAFVQQRGRGLPVHDRQALLETLGWEIPPEDPVALAARWVAEMDRYGIDRMVLLTSLVGDEASVATAVQAFPERFIGYIRVDPHQPDMPDRVEYALGTLGLRGIKGFPAMECFHAYDEIVYPLYELAAAYQVPVLWHFGLLQSAIGAHLKLPSQADARYSNPMDLQKAARDFPTVPFIIPHFGAGYFGETLLAAAHCPNIFIDTSSANGWIRYLPYPLDLQGVFARTLQAVGPERIIFGTDSSWFPRGFRADVLETQLQILAALQVPREAVELIMGGNMARILRLE